MSLPIGELVWKEPDPAGGENITKWLIPVDPVASDLVLKDVKDRCFWYEYASGNLSLLNLSKDFTEEEWKSEPATTLTWFDGVQNHSVSLPVGLVTRHAPVLVSSVPAGKEFVFTSNEERPLVPLTPVKAVIELVEFSLPQLPNNVFTVGISPTTPDNINEYVPIKIGDLRFMYCRSDTTLYEVAPELSEPLSNVLSPDSVGSEVPKDAESTRLVDYPSSSDDEVDKAKVDEKGQRDEVDNQNKNFSVEASTSAADEVSTSAADEASTCAADEASTCAADEASTSSADEKISRHELDAGASEADEVVTVDPTLIDGTHIIICEGWRKETRRAKGGRVHVYLWPPDETNRLRSYRDLEKWVRRRAESDQEIEYDWGTINFDRVDGEMSVQCARSKAAFLDFVNKRTSSTKRKQKAVKLERTTVDEGDPLNVANLHREEPSSSNLPVKRKAVKSQRTVVEVVKPNSRTTTGQALTPKERWRLKGTAFEHICPDCKKGFRLRQLLSSHRSQCLKCPTCGHWRDLRHAEICRTYQQCQHCDRWLPQDHKCRGTKATRCKRIHCKLCNRLICKSYMYRHFDLIHGRKWSRPQHPECLSEDEYSDELEKEAKLEVQKKEIESQANEIQQLRAERFRLLKALELNSEKLASTSAKAVKRAKTRQKK